MMKMLLIVLFASLSSSPAFAGDSLPDCGNEHKFDYHFLEALRLKEKGDHTGAHDALQQALNIDSTSSAALFELSRYYLFLKNDVLALDALQKAVHYNPEHFEYKIALAGLCREMRKYPESIAIYEELAGKYPAKPEIHFYLSDLYLRMRQIDKSISALDALENNTGINEAVSMQK
jgi:tetratricopeptide (TPR) repeat protein